jgi:hypothetical protein
MDHKGAKKLIRTATPLGKSVKFEMVLQTSLDEWNFGVESTEAGMIMMTMIRAMMLKVDP